MTRLDLLRTVINKALTLDSLLVLKRQQRLDSITKASIALQKFFGFQLDQLRFKIDQ